MAKKNDKKEVSIEDKNKTHKKLKVMNITTRICFSRINVYENIYRLQNF